MPDNESGQSPADRKAKNTAKESMSKRLLKRDADTASLIYSSIAAILGVISGGLLSYHFTVPGVLFGVAFSFVLSVPIYYQVSFHQFKALRFGTQPIWGVCGSALCTSAIATFIIFRPLAPVAAFNIVPGFGFSAPTYSLDKLGRLVAGGESQGTLVLYQVHWLIYATLSNNQDIPTTIEKIQAFDVRTNSPYCEIDLRTAHLFFVGTTESDAFEWGTENSLDKRLVERSIQPHETVSGWLAWQCPTGICGPKVKLLISEANGRVSETMPFKLSSPDAPLQNAGFSVVQRNVDLTKSPRKIVSACKRPDYTGVSALLPPE